MSLLGSLNTAASGLEAHAEALDVVSDNIANVDTVGYKSGRGRFEEVLGSTVAGATDAGAAGQGARMGGVERQFTQGSLTATDNATDLAIQGDGFFITQGNYQGNEGSFYTRAGQFHIDESGRFVDPNGLVVQGYAADAAGNVGSTLTDVRVPATAAVPPRPSTDVTLAANLNAADSVLPAFDATTPDTTSNFSTSVTVYDSLGGAHNVDVYFHKSNTTGDWDWHGLVDGGEVGGTAGVPTECASGTLGFTTDGFLNTQATTASSFSFTGATANQAIAFNFGDDLTAGGTGQQGLTSYASDSSVSSIQQDGYAPGVLSGVSVNESGIVTGTFTNGQQRTLAQMATARFRDNGGLVRAGSGYYVSSPTSGAALVGAPSSGGRGALATGSLEQSNVDLAKEMVTLIAYQHGYEANSRAIRTADDMLRTLVALKQ